MISRFLVQRLYGVDDISDASEKKNIPFSWLLFRQVWV